MCAFLTVAKLLDRNDLVEFFEEAVNEICGRNQKNYNNAAELAYQNMPTDKLKDMDARESLILH